MSKDGVLCSLNEDVVDNNVHREEHVRVVRKLMLSWKCGDKSQDISFSILDVQCNGVCLNLLTVETKKILLARMWC